MSEHELRPEHRRLRELLREADPASGERLPPEAVAAMRRRTLEEAEAHRDVSPGLLQLPRTGLVAAAAVLAVVMGLALTVAPDDWLPASFTSTFPDIERGREDAGTPGATADGREPAAPSAESPSSTTSGDPGDSASDATAATGPSDQDPDVTGVVAGAAPPPPPPSREDAGAAPADRRRKPRDVRFTTPGGTEIIWTLDPNFEPPVRSRNPGRGDPR